MRTLVAVDGGKSALRVRIDSPTGRQLAEGSGFAYYDATAELSAIIDAIQATAPPLQIPARSDAVCVGLTGVPGEPADRDRLRRHLAELFHGPVLLAADVVLAHAGALAGPGVIVSAGTGTNVLALSSAGRSAQVDGWGPIIGDRGSGYAIGRAGLQAAAAALDDVGPDTALTDTMRRFLGGVELAALQELYRDPSLISSVAGFATSVVAAADDGDPVAAEICDSAADDLAMSASSAAAKVHLHLEERLVSHAGRLLQPDRYLARAFERRVASAGLRLAEPIGDSLDGGIRIATNVGLYSELLLDLPERTSR